VGCDQVDQRLPGQHHLHLSQKLFSLGLLPGDGELIIREAELPAIPSTQVLAKGHTPIVPWMAWVFQSLPDILQEEALKVVTKQDSYLATPVRLAKNSSSKD